MSNIYVRLLERVEASPGSDILLVTRAERAELVEYLDALGVLAFVNDPAYPDQFSGRLLVLEDPD